MFMVVQLSLFIQFLCDKIMHDIFQTKAFPWTPTMINGDNPHPTGKGQAKLQGNAEGLEEGKPAKALPRH